VSYTSGAAADMRGESVEHEGGMEALDQVLPVFTPKYHLTGSENLFVVLYDGENSIDEEFMKTSGWDYIQVQNMNDVAKIIDKNETIWRKSFGIKNLVIKTHGGSRFMEVNSTQVSDPNDELVAEGFNSMKKIINNTTTIMLTACSFLCDDETSGSKMVDFWTGNSNRTIFINTIYSGTMGHTESSGETKIKVDGGKINFDTPLARHNDHTGKLDSWNRKGFIRFHSGKRTYQKKFYHQIAILKKGGFRITLKPPFVSH
jgi:hypothetical protein